MWEEILKLRRKVTVQTDFFHIRDFFSLLLSLEVRTRGNFNVNILSVRGFEAGTPEALVYQIDHDFSQKVKAKATDWDKETLPT